MFRKLGEDYEDTIRIQVKFKQSALVNMDLAEARQHLAAEFKEVAEKVFEQISRL